MSEHFQLAPASLYTGSPHACPVRGSRERGVPASVGTGDPGTAHPWPCHKMSFPPTLFLASLLHPSSTTPSAAFQLLLPPTGELSWSPPGMMLSASQVTPPHPISPSRLILPGAAGPYSATPSSVQVNPSLLGQRCSEEAS